MKYVMLETDDGRAFARDQVKNRIHINIQTGESLDEKMKRRAAYERMKSRQVRCKTCGSPDIRLGRCYDCGRTAR